MKIIEKIKEMRKNSQTGIYNSFMSAEKHKLKGAKTLEEAATRYDRICAIVDFAEALGLITPIDRGDTKIEIEDMLTKVAIIIRYEKAEALAELKGGCKNGKQN